MSAYLDASVAVSLFVNDGHTGAADEWLRGLSAPVTLSLWTAAEFSAALAARARNRALAPAERTTAEQGFTEWSRGMITAAVLDSDMVAARDMIRFDQAPLKAGDALHLALAVRLGLPIKTFDQALARAAEAVGMKVV